VRSNLLGAWARQPALATKASFGLRGLQGLLKHKCVNAGLGC
jgi:hypothetical protein